MEDRKYKAEPVFCYYGLAPQHLLLLPHLPHLENSHYVLRLEMPALPEEASNRIHYSVP